MSCLFVGANYKHYESTARLHIVIKENTKFRNKLCVMLTV